MWKPSKKANLVALIDSKFLQVDDIQIQNIWLGVEGFCDLGRSFWDELDATGPLVLFLQRN